MEHSIITECLCKSFGEKQVLNSISLKVKREKYLDCWDRQAPVKRHF